MSSLKERFVLPESEDPREPGRSYRAGKPLPVLSVPKKAEPNPTTAVIETNEPSKKVGRVRKTLDDAFHWGAWKLIELTQEELSKVQEIGAEVEVGSGNTLGVRLGTQVFVVKDALPAELTGPSKTYSQRLLDAKQEHCVVRTRGVTEWGTRRDIAGVLPISEMVHVGIGGKINGAVMYEHQAAYEVEPRALPRMLKDRTIAIPVTPTSALALHEGAWARFTASGQLCVLASGGLGPEVGAGKIRLGASAGVEVKLRAEGIVSLEVMRLSGSKVRVKVSELREGAAELGAKLRAGLTWDNVVDPKIEWGDGLLRAALKTQGYSSLDTWLRELASASASISGAIGRLDREIDSWVIDLATPDGRRAFKDLLRFSTVRAEAYARAPGSGVTRATLEERNTQRRAEAEIKLFGQRVFLREALRRRTEGHLTGAEGAELDYRRSELARKRHDLVHGSRELQLETVTIRAGDEDPTSYFELKYQNDDRATVQKELDEFVTLARRLGCEGANSFDSRTEQLHGLRSFFSSANDSKRSLDLFFTERGIRDIDQTSYEQARAAYLEEALAFDPQLLERFPFLSDGNEQRSTAIALMNAYADRHRPHGVCKVLDVLSCGRRKHGAAEGLSEDYRDALGRDLESDMRALEPTLRAADEFGRAVADLVVHQRSGVRARRNVEIFFERVLGSRHLRFFPAVAALARLAGPEDVYVHELKVETARAKLVARDEGMIDLHLDERVESEIDRAA